MKNLNNLKHSNLLKCDLLTIYNLVDTIGLDTTFINKMNILSELVETTNEIKKILLINRVVDLRIGQIIGSIYKLTLNDAYNNAKLLDSIFEIIKSYNLSHNDYDESAVIRDMHALAQSPNF